MADSYPEIASHVPRAGMTAVRLYGGPWHGKEVYVRDQEAPRLLVYGPRQGDHRVWIAHLYARFGDRFEYQRTGVTGMDFIG